MIRRLPWEAALAGGFLVALLAELAIRGELKPGLVLWTLALAAPLSGLRRWPIPAAMGTLVVAALYSRSAAPLASLTVPIALFTALPFCIAALSGFRWAVAGLAISLAGEAVAFGWNDVLWTGAAVSAGFWAGGLYLRDRIRLAADLRDINRRLAAERDARARLAVLEERAFVARELHDVVGHTLTVIVLQAGAARRLWESDPGRGRRALQTVAETARGGLADVLQSLRALERGEARLEIADVRSIVDIARAAGLHIDLDISAPPVDAAVATAVYRVVQEALTNALKHAPGGSASVRIACRDQALELDVVNTLQGPALPSVREGQGLRNMKARVAERCGRFDWDVSDGQFRVHARLPVGA